MVAHWSLAIDFSSKPRFAEMSAAEAVDGLTGAIRERLASSLGKIEIEIDIVDPKGIRGHEGDSAAWQAFSHGSSADRFVLIRLDKWKQKNRSSEEILLSPNRAASKTAVEVRMWTYDPKTTTLIVPGRQVLTGMAGAGFFGTTNRGDMQGSPDARALEIRNNGRKRMQAIAAAVWDALKVQIAPPGS